MCSCAYSDVRHILRIDETSDVNNSTRTVTNACDYKNVISHATQIQRCELNEMFELALHVCEVACRFWTECFQALSMDFKEKYLEETLILKSPSS